MARWETFSESREKRFQSEEAWGGPVLKALQLLKVRWPREIGMTMSRQNSAPWCKSESSLARCYKQSHLLHSRPIRIFPTCNISQKGRGPLPGSERAKVFHLCENPISTVLIKLKPGFHFFAWTWSFCILGTFDTIFAYYACSLEEAVVSKFLEFRSEDHIVSSVSMGSA